MRKRTVRRVFGPKTPGKQKVLGSQGEINVLLANIVLKKKSNLFHVDLILIQHNFLRGHFLDLKPLFCRNYYTTNRWTVSNCTFCMCLQLPLVISLSLVSLLHVWLNKQMQRKRCIIYETRLSPSWRKCKQVAAN